MRVGTWVSVALLSWCLAAARVSAEWPAADSTEAAAWAQAEPTGGEPAAEPPRNDDELTQRLAHLEAEIAALRSALETQPTAWQAPATGGTPGAASAGAADVTATRKEFTAWWTEMKNSTYPNVTVNAAFQADTGFFSQDAASVAAHGDLQDGADFRRARLSAKAAITETVNGFFQMDFAFFGRPTFTDLWVENTSIPGIGTIRFGQWKQPFSLEVVSSYRYTTFMERSVLFQPFTPFRHVGAGFYNHSEDLNWTWAASGFRSGQDQFGGSISTDGGWGTAERITHLLFWDEPSDGHAYIHTGLGHYFSNPAFDAARFRTIPEIYIGENAPGVVGTSGQPAPGAFQGTPFFVDTGNLTDVSSFNVLGTELLWVHGPWSLQSETMVDLVNREANPNPTFWGFYSQVGYFLTGEHRPYDRINGTIDRVIPRSNFFCVPTAQGVGHGPGAWEVAARISYVDLTSNGVPGGTLTDFTAGVNWYWNPYTKMVFNYIHAWNDQDQRFAYGATPPGPFPGVGPNDTDIFAARIQMDF